MKLPSIQFYPGDWKKDPGIQCLTLEEKGAWFEMLLLMFESQERGVLTLNYQPYSEEDLAIVLHCELAKLKQILSKLLSKGVASKRESDGAIYCRRMLKDNELREIRAKSGALGGLKKASKMPSKPLANSTPSSSSSSSTSVSISKDIEEMVSLWNSSGLPKIVNFGSKRKVSLKKRFEEVFFRDNWRAGISKLQASGFCNGQNDRGWRADFDFFLRPGSLEKIMEGKYDNRSEKLEQKPIIHGDRFDEAIKMLKVQK